MRRALLVGAMRVETSPLVALLSGPRPRGLRLVVGRLAGIEVGVLTCGVGPEKARSRTAEALDAFRPDLALSLGTCGALADGLRIGDVVHGARLLDDEGEVGALRALGAPSGAVLTVREPVWEAQRRRALAARGALVCEMEAAAVYRACQDRGVAVAVAKVVSDLAGAESDSANPDRALPRTPGRPGPLEVARFKARALHLVQRGLVPLVPGMLRAAAG